MKFFIFISLLLINNAYSNDSYCLKPYSYKIKDFQLKKCKKLNQFIIDNKNSNIYMVLAEPFLKNPASLFGHNFLLFSKNNPKDSVSGFTLNFEAVDNSDNSFEYFYKGVFGKFKGRYNLKKFYNNIKLYNNFEDRDLIIYRLDYSRKEKYQYLLKAWEYSMNSQDIPYFFFNGNCAFYISDFLKSQSPSTSRPALYYSPKDSLLDLNSKTKEEPLKLPSIKKEIQLHNRLDNKLSKLYANSQYQIYMARRGKKHKKLKSSLLELNQHKMKTNNSLKKLKLLSPNNKVPYAKFEISSSSKNNWQLKGSVVKNTYFSKTGNNRLELLTISSNNFNKQETELILIDMKSNLIYENKFKEISWDIAFKHQNKQSLEFTSTNLTSAIGLTHKLAGSTFATIKGNTIIDSNFIDLYPSFNIFSLIDKFEFQLNFSQKYRRDYTRIKISYDIYDNTHLSLGFEEFKKHESRVFTSLEFSL